MYSLGDFLIFNSTKGTNNSSHTIEQLSSETALKGESRLLIIISIMQGNLISHHNYRDVTLHL